jgi:hypothetical protein
MRLVLAGVRKFRTRTASTLGVIIAGLIVGAEMALIGVSLKTAPPASTADLDAIKWFVQFPGAYDAIIAFTFIIGGLVALIYVAAVAGSEWTWGTLKNAVARGESRSRYAAATFASISIVLLAGLLLVFAAGMIGSLIGASVAGVSTSGVGDSAALVALPVKLARCWIALIGLCSVGYALTMMAKSPMAGVGAVIGLFLVSAIAPALLPEIVQQIFRYLPFSIGSDAIGLQGPPGSGAGNLIDPNLALLVTVGWAVASIAVAAIAVERAEITN